MIIIMIIKTTIVIIIINNDNMNNKIFKHMLKMCTLRGLKIVLTLSVRPDILLPPMLADII